MKRLTLFLGFIILLPSMVMAGGPEGVSPSGMDVAVVGSSCPTFSWSEISGAEGYVIEVYEMVTSEVQTHEVISSSSQPVISKRLGRALSWTPSGAECLKELRYVWYVGASLNAETEWSGGKVFEINLLSNTETVNAMKETVSNYLTNEWTKTEAYTKVKEEIKKEIKESSNLTAKGDISIMAYEGTTNTLYGQGAGASISNSGAGPPDYNTFIGSRAGYNTTSGTNSWDGDYNTFVGYYAGYSNTTGNSNTFVGYEAGYSNTTGNSNTFVGYDAGYSNTTGYSNIFMGNWAGDSNTTGHFNTFVGHDAGYSNTTGNYNTFVGSGAGYYNTTGSGNVFLGYGAGYNERGSNKLYIANSDTAKPLIYGDFSTGRIGIGMNNPQAKIDLGGGAITVNGDDVSAGTAAGQQRPQFGWTETGRAIMGWGGAGGANMEFYSKGHSSRPGEYYIVYGGSSTIGKVLFAHYNGTGWTTTLSMLHNGYVGFRTLTPSHPLHHANGAYLSAGGVWTNASSREYKEKIESLKAYEALEALKGLNPVKFTYKSDPEERHVGFIAEEVPALVATKDRKALSAMDIVAVLTGVVKEQQAEIEKLKAENLKYEERISKLEAQNKNLEADNQAIKAEFKEKMAYLERQLLFLNSIAASQVK